MSIYSFDITHWQFSLPHGFFFIDIYICGVIKCHRCPEIKDDGPINNILITHDVPEVNIHD
jgi:hypothetical protein